MYILYELFIVLVRQERDARASGGKFHSTEEFILADFDEHYLSEVIGNLLSNAIKYSAVGTEINIAVSLDTDKVLTEVIDQGKGIPEKEQLKLFNYFQTTSSKPTAGDKSTALDLP